MIPAAQSCPRCLKTKLTVEPQPTFREKRGRPPYGQRYWYFVCETCCLRWTCERSEGNAHFDFLVRIGHLRPNGELAYSHEVERARASAAAALLSLRNQDRAG